MKKKRKKSFIAYSMWLDYFFKYSLYYNPPVNEFKVNKDCKKVRVTIEEI